MGENTAERVGSDRCVRDTRTGCPVRGVSAATEREGVPVNRVVIIGGGPAGYESALVAAQLGAEVTVVEAEGAGGACVLHDCVPSKTFIATSDVVTGYRDTERFGVRGGGLDAICVDAEAVHARVKRLATAQSADIATKLGK